MQSSPALRLTERRIKTLELASKTLAEQDKSPEAVTKQGQAVSGKERETEKKPKKRKKLKRNRQRDE